MNDEELFLTQIIFKKNITSVIQNLNIDQFVKIASSQLLLPCVYVNLIKKNYQKRLPKDLLIYLKKINQINKNRNIKLIAQLNRISKIFKEYKIDYVFLKGSSLILGNYFDDISERMVGDIDILVSDSDYFKSHEVLKKINYEKQKGFREIGHRHGPRLINKSELFAVEIHKKLLSYNNKKLDPTEYLRSKKIINGHCLPSDKNLAKHLILSFMINDYGNLNAAANLRLIYDIKKVSFNLIKNDLCKEVKRFFIISNALNITDFKVKKGIKDQLFINRFFLKKRNMTYFKIDNFICKIIILIPKLFMQMIEFIFNKNYRKNIVKKYLSTL